MVQTAPVCNYETAIVNNKFIQKAEKKRKGTGNYYSFLFFIC